MNKFAEYKLEKRSVNNKYIFEEIHKFIEEGILSGEVLWESETHRISFVEIVENVLDELEFDEKIDQSNVMCDFRNNNVAEMERGNYVLEVSYRQRNCINTTRLVYHIRDLTQDSKIKNDSVDFSI